jgi:hypothetical protein
MSRKTRLYVISRRGLSPFSSGGQGVDEVFDERRLSPPPFANTPGAEVPSGKPVAAESVLAKLAAVSRAPWASLSEYEIHYSPPKA